MARDPPSPPQSTPGFTRPHAYGGGLSNSLSQVADLFRQRASLGLSPPTNAEICDAVGWASPASSRDAVQDLITAGILVAAQGKARGARLAEGNPVGAMASQLSLAAFMGKDIDRSHVCGEVAVPRALHHSGDPLVFAAPADEHQLGVCKDDLVVAYAVEAVHAGDVVVAWDGTDIVIGRLEHRNDVWSISHAKASTQLLDGAVVHALVSGIMRSFEPRERGPALRLHGLPSAKEESIGSRP